MNRPTNDELQQRLRDFAAARDWEQFHTPKDLAMSVAIEAGELLEVFQWRTDAQISEGFSDPEHQRKLADELADVFIYLLRLADVTGLDLSTVASDKIDRNEIRFPPVK